MGRQHVFVALLLVILGLVPSVTLGQPSSSNPVPLPASVSLSDVQIQLTTGGGDGCLGRCIAWGILVRGNGLVELDDLGTPPKLEAKQRTIDSDTVVELVNRFLKARFFYSLDYYGGVSSAVRNGDSLALLGGVAGTGPWTELTLRLGSAAKTIRLRENIPAELQSLRDRVWQIGGPDAWRAK